MVTSLKKEPQRTCVVCRSNMSKRTLHRIVRSPDGVVRYDPTGKAPGRGAYLCGRPECLAAARRRHSLERSLKAGSPAEIEAVLEDVRTAVSSAPGPKESGPGPAADEARHQPGRMIEEEVRTA